VANAFQLDAAREYQRKYYLEHREQKLAYSRANQARANQRRRELNAARPKRRTFPYAETRLNALRIISGLETPRCIACGIDEPRVLVINHKNGNGNTERRTGLVGKGLYKAIVLGKRTIEDLDVRCQNCNTLYEYERGRLR
jgi:hypothetical protein